MEFQFSAGHPSEWFANFAEKFNLKQDGNRLTVPPSMGQGFLEQHALPNGFFLTLMDLKLFKAVVARRSSNPAAGYFPLIIYFSALQATQEVGGQQRPIGKHTPNGMFFPSPRIESTFDIPANEPVTILTITLPRRALEAYFLQEEGPLFSRLIRKNQPFFLFEALSGPEQFVVQQLLNQRLSSPANQVFLFAKVLELAALFVEKINKRESQQLTQSLAPQDVARLFQIRQQLEEAPAHPPTIPQLSREYGISESKLQRNFKAVFGRSVYQHVLQYRMQQAKAMLETGRYTVSEVGFELGYTNMSKFSQAFRKQFGINPKELL